MRNKTQHRDSCVGAAARGWWGDAGLLADDRVVNVAVEAGATETALPVISLKRRAACPREISLGDELELGSAQGHVRVARCSVDRSLTELLGAHREHPVEGLALSRLLLVVDDRLGGSLISGADRVRLSRLSLSRQGFLADAVFAVPCSTDAIST